MEEEQILSIIPQKSQIVLDSTSNEGLLDNIVDTIFTFYEHFLNDDTDQERSDMSSSSSSTSTTSSSSFQSEEIVKTETRKLKLLFESSSASSTSNQSSKKMKLDDKSEYAGGSEKLRIPVDFEATLLTKITKPLSMNTLTDGSIETRLVFLMKVPTLIGEAVNSTNHKQLQNIIENAFLPNCTLKTSALPNEIIGRQHVIEMYQGMIRTVPDYLINIIRPEINHHIISAKMFTSGTLMCHANDPSDYLFNYLKYQPPLEDNQKEHEANLKEARDKHVSFTERGKPISFKTRAVMHLILNEELTHVAKFTYFSKGVEINETSFRITK